MHVRRMRSENICIVKAHCVPACQHKVGSQRAGPFGGQPVGGLFPLKRTYTCL